jgi:hypothetical protein
MERYADDVESFDFPRDLRAQRRHRGGGFGAHRAAVPSDKLVDDPSVERNTSTHTNPNTNPHRNHDTGIGSARFPCSFSIFNNPRTSSKRDYKEEAHVR